jgi:hypothetical protein
MDSTFARVWRALPKFPRGLAVFVGIVVIGGAFWGMDDTKQHKEAPPPVEG